MHPFEELQCKVAALSLRIDRLEKLHEPDHLRRYDVAQALAVVARLGLDGTALGSSRNFFAKARVAVVLKGQGWTSSRIARAMSCSEKSVRRWVRGERQTKNEKQN